MYTDNLLYLYQQYADDLVLIDRFIQHTINFQEVDLVTSNLQVTVHDGISQIYSKQEGLLASANLTAELITIGVRQSNSYCDFIQRALLQVSYFPVSERVLDDCINYEYREVPSGYLVNCTQAKNLWRLWSWQGHQRRVDLGISLNLLIPYWGVWHPVRDIQREGDLLIIKALGRHITTQVSQSLIWLKKHPR